VSDYRGAAAVGCKSPAFLLFRIKSKTSVNQQRVFCKVLQGLTILGTRRLIPGKIESSKIIQDDSYSTTLSGILTSFILKSNLNDFIKEYFEMIN